MTFVRPKTSPIVETGAQFKLQMDLSTTVLLRTDSVLSLSLGFVGFCRIEATHSKGECTQFQDCFGYLNQEPMFCKKLHIQRCYIEPQCIFTSSLKKNRNYSKLLKFKAANTGDSSRKHTGEPEPAVKCPWP